MTAKSTARGNKRTNIVLFNSTIKKGLNQVKNSKNRMVDTSNAILKVSCESKMELTQLDIRWNGYWFVTYLFKTNKGWSIYVENWQICCQISEPTDVVYNTQKLTPKFNNEYMAEAISWAICRWWKGEVLNLVDNN